MKTLTLKKTGYTIKGVADLTMWGGGNGCIEMKSFDVKNISVKTLLKNINDNGFGVEKINGAICTIYENFDGYLVYHSNVTVGIVSEHTENYFNENF